MEQAEISQFVQDVIAPSIGNIKGSVTVAVNGYAGASHLDVRPPENSKRPPASGGPQYEENTMRYEIFEDNMPRLIKKMATIEKKCRQYGCEFHFEEVGDVYYKVTLDGTETILRYVIVEAEGTAQVNNWEFVASIQHMTPVNLISSYKPEYTIPERYYTSPSNCEHCNSKRNRKDTYLIRNTITGEWKQVGKSCLMDFTKGMSAEAVAQYLSWFDELVKGKSCDGVPHSRYHSTLEVIMISVEAVRRYGYKRTQDEFGSHNYDSTASVVSEMIYHINPMYKKRLEEGFNWNTPETEQKATEILNWVRASNPELGSYLCNLKAACGNDYCESRNFGIIASAVAAYNRETEKKHREEQRKQMDAKSSWVGSVGDRIDLADVSLSLLTSWDTEYGYTYLYKMVDSVGNVFTWKTGKWLGGNDSVAEGTKINLRGTIKNHTEFRGTKQTELTRCKVY